NGRCRLRRRDGRARGPGLPCSGRAGASPPAMRSRRRDGRGGMTGLLNRHLLLYAMATDRNLSRTDVACGAVLLELFNEAEGAAWPSYETIAARANCHRSAVARSISRLIAKGYVERVSGGGRGRSNRYRPCLETVARARRKEEETVAPTRPF